MPTFEHPFAGMTSDRKLTKEELIRAIRFSIAAEYEAIQLYNQLAESIDDELAIKVLNHVADEEKEHVGEFWKVLTILAPDEIDFYKSGEQEVEEEMEEMRFSSESEALQYLSNFTGKRIKIAGSIKGPGIPDGTGPMKDSEDCVINSQDQNPEPKPPQTIDMGDHIEYAIEHLMWEEGISREEAKEQISKKILSASEDFKFSSVNEALQHLADFTGKKVKIASENLSDIKVLYREGDGSMKLWGIPYGMRPNQSPKDLKDADNTKDWIYLGVPGSEKPEVKEYLKAVESYVPTGPGEWDEPKVDEVGHLFDKKLVEGTELGQSITIPNGEVRIWMSPDDGNYIVQWIDSTGRIAQGSDASVESFEEAVGVVDDIRPEYI
jgi:rubrerythrin